MAIAAIGTATPIATLLFWLKPPPPFPLPLPPMASASSVLVAEAEASVAVTLCVRIAVTKTMLVSGPWLPVTVTIVDKTSDVVISVADASLSSVVLCRSLLSSVEDASAASVVGFA